MMQEDENKKPEKNDGATENQQREQQTAGNQDDTTKKIIFALCYLWGILFFLPLILYKDDPEAKRHANAGLVLLLFAVIGNVVFGVLTVFGGFMHTLFSIVASVYSLLLLILGILGIVNVVNDRKEDLPIIGSFKLIK